MDINNDHKENESSVYEEENVIEEIESSIKKLISEVLKENWYN